MQKAYKHGALKFNGSSAFRVYEYRMCLELCGLNPFPDQDKLNIVRDTILYSENLDLVNIITTEEYEITHILFYLTYFGKSNLPEFFDKYQIKYIEDLILLLTGKNILNKNTDLLGEYIMCACFLGIKNKIITTAMELLAKEQTEVGIVKAAKYTYQNDLNDEIIQKMSTKDIDAKFHYHSTFVFILTFISYLKTHNEIYA